MPEILLQVHAKVGNAVRKLLPAGLNPKILEQLEASFGGNTPGRAASPPVPAVAKRMSEHSVTPKRAVDDSAPKRATPPASRHMTTSMPPAATNGTGTLGAPLSTEFLCSRSNQSFLDRKDPRQLYGM